MLWWSRARGLPPGLRQLPLQALQAVRVLALLLALLVPLGCSTLRARHLIFLYNLLTVMAGQAFPERCACQGNPSGSAIPLRIYLMLITTFVLSYAGLAVCVLPSLWCILFREALMLILTIAGILIQRGI